MADIRYVVLSDLHFGADNSVLTSLIETTTPAGRASFTADPTTASPLLAATLTALRSLIAGQDEPPTLILAGDVLDLALSPDAVANGTFEHFANLAFTGKNRMFGPVVYYLPGNHDHHLWEAAREAQYLHYLDHLDPQVLAQEPWHVSPLRLDAQRPEAANLMTTLIRRQPGCDDVTVRVVYPNMALVDSERGRYRVVSHGHYTEGIYTLMSQLKTLLFPDPSAPPPDMAIDQMEAENFAWIDFFWSTLGRSGAVGTDIGLIYADLTSPKDLDALARNLTQGLLANGHGPGWLRPLERRFASFLACREARHVAASERGTPDVTLTPKGRLGVEAYLRGPVRRQLQAELGQVPVDLEFVFGHTHKPFVSEWPLAGFPGTVRMANTGGWVVDTAIPAQTQGGVAVVIDDDLNTASVEFYRQSADGGTGAPGLLDPAGSSHSSHDDAFAFRAALAARIVPDRPEWRAVSTAAAELIAQRHRLQASLVDGPA
jgi:UDP-2,3-diacylglucosamine pyrophosphatase LpxH